MAVSGAINRQNMAISGAINCQNVAISGAINSQKGRQILYHHDQETNSEGGSDAAHHGNDRGHQEGQDQAKLSELSGKINLHKPKPTQTFLNLNCKFNM